MLVTLRRARRLIQSFLQVLLHESPRGDVVRGIAHWRWLLWHRLQGNYVDRSVQIRSESRNHEGLQLEPSVAIDRGCVLWLGRDGARRGRLCIGRGSYIGPYCYLGSFHDLIIGQDVLIGASSYLITVNHCYSSCGMPVSEQGYAGDRIEIGNNVWIGAHVVILPGVRIGNGAVIGASSVVRTTVPEGEVWAGVPAKFIKAAKDNA